jgi:hypothetical protein
MIFIQNKSNNIRSRLGVALLSDNKQPTVITKPQEKRDSNPNINIFQDIKEDEKEEEPIIKLNNPKESNKEKEKEKQMRDKFVTSVNNIFSLNKKSSSIKKNKKNYVVKLKNNMLFPINVPGCTPYDPYLINICKNAIIKVKDELPNYKEIIKKINTEFGIEEGNDLVELNTDNIAFNTFNSFNSFTKTKTNFTRDKNMSNADMNTKTNFSKNNEINDNDNFTNNNHFRERRFSKKKK